MPQKPSQSPSPSAPLPALTLLDLTNQISEYFLDHTIFTFDEFGAINIPKEYNEIRNDLISAALDEMESEGFIKRVNEAQWILLKPIGFAGQDVHLSMETSVTVSATINAFLDAHNVPGNRSDALNLGEMDIVTLLQIIQSVISTEPKVGGSSGGAN